MCKTGRCVYRRVSVEPSGFICTRCDKFIEDKLIKQHPRRYERHRYNARVYSGPYDGGSVRLPFNIRRFWVTAECNAFLFELEHDEVFTQSLYEYEIEPFGDFVFVKIRVGVKRDAS
jgi:hypothetical protein